MNTKEIKITVPEGYEIDKENSTFECIKFKKKGLTYEDVAEKLFKGKKTYYIASPACINDFTPEWNGMNHANNATSKKKQLQRLLAINKLMNVAEYLNEGWKPDYFSDGIPKWTIIYDKEKHTFDFHQEWFVCYSPVVFKSTKLAREEIEKYRQYQLTGAAIDYCRKEFPHFDGEAHFGITDAFEAGAEWEHKRLIEKACEWLSDNKDSYIIDIEGETLVDDQIIKDFRKAMEE